jgi:hypothetical protein
MANQNPQDAITYSPEQIAEHNRREEAAAKHAAGVKKETPAAGAVQPSVKEAPPKKKNARR